MKSKHQLMRRIYHLISTTFLFAACIAGANAQCSFMIPHSLGHIKLDHDQTISDLVGSIYWICEGVTITVDSSAGSVFVMETGSTLILNSSDGSQIYAKDNCHITDNSDESQNISKTSSATHIDNGSAADIITNCTSMVYDYTLVGGSSCVGTVGIGEQSVKEIVLYPSIVNGSDQITIDGVTGLIQIDVYDLTGKRVFSKQKSTSRFTLENMNSGYYQVIVTDEHNQIYRSKIIVTANE